MVTYIIDMSRLPGRHNASSYPDFRIWILAVAGKYMHMYLGLPHTQAGLNILLFATQDFVYGLDLATVSRMWISYDVHFTFLAVLGTESAEFI